MARREAGALLRWAMNEVEVRGITASLILRLWAQIFMAKHL